MKTNLSNNPKLEKTLNKIYNLPALPSIVAEALRLLNNRNTNTYDLVNIISKDQSFISKILTVANSPIYGLRREVSTIDFAILVLGFSEIKNIVFALSFIESFRNSKDRYFDQNEFWFHSFIVGNVARKIAENIGYAKSGEVFIAGFMHDFAISTLHRFMHDDFKQIVDLVNNENKTYPEAELEILGVSHSRVGEYLLEKWNFPLHLCRSVASHHEPLTNTENRTLTSIIHLADYMAKKFQVGNFNWDKDLELDYNIAELFGFTNNEDFDVFIEGYKSFFEQQTDSTRYLG